MSAFEDAVIQRIKQLEREVERLQRWERAADLGLVASANNAWNFKPAGTDLFIVDSMSLSNVIVPSGHNLLVEFDAIGFFRDIYGANIHLYNSTTLLETFVAPMRMNVASARAGFHYSYKITTGGTYNLSIRCAASGSTAVDMDFLNRSLKATVI